MYSTMRNGVTTEIAAIVEGTDCHVDHFPGSLLVCISVDNPLILHWLWSSWSWFVALSTWIGQTWQHINIAIVLWHPCWRAEILWCCNALDILLDFSCQIYCIHLLSYTLITTNLANQVISYQNLESTGIHWFVGGDQKWTNANQLCIGYIDDLRTVV